MSYIPKVTHIVGAGGWNSRSPGIVTVNFDPTSADYEEFVTNIADGTLLIQYAESDGEVPCDSECAVALYMKGCSDCDDPVVTLVVPAGLADTLADFEDRIAVLET